MTRGSIPRFDLYEELEISRLASVEVVEAAYRALVKRHHPDVSRPDDAERIKRLNVAREWLTSPAKRARYDAATSDLGSRSSTAGPPTRARAAAKASPRPAGEPARPARASSPASFGVHSREVRQFLAELRSLDGPRARELLDGRSTLDSTAYSEARGAALVASRTGRTAEWTFAREAASVIARGKLHDPPVAAGVATIVADIAGAIVVRDLLSTRDFELLLRPWTWREEPGIDAGVGAAAVRRIDLASVTAGAVAAVRARRPVALGAAAVAVVVLVWLSLLGRGPVKPDSAVAALTNPPSTATSPAAPGGVANASPASSMPGPVVPGASTPIASPGPAVTTGPGATAAPGIQPGGPVPTPRVTPTPGSSVLPSALPSAAPTPAATLLATPVPTSVPPPTLAPTPSPQTWCTVVSLIGVNTSNAQLTWSTAGFTGTVLFGTPIPPQYKIGWQSLAAGDAAPCTSDITVQLLAP